MRVLLATASTYGSTKEIADAVSEELRAAAHHVTMHSAEHAGSLEYYDAVVLGSAVYIGRVLTPGRQFAARLAKEFAPKPVWVFASGLKNVTPYPLEAPFTTPKEPPYYAGRYTTFGGFVERDKLSLAERSLIGFVGASQHDERDFDLIRAWAQAVAEEMGALEAAPAPEM